MRPVHPSRPHYRGICPAAGPAGPYGAENPAPVFLLEKAVVEGVYPVSEGRHCRLRLRQGNACIYAVWFGMHPEQLPYATGDVVDAA